MQKDETITTKKEAQTSIIQPDPETLHTTDTQDQMKGPLSSLVNSAKENMEESNDDKEAADKKKGESK